MASFESRSAAHRARPFAAPRVALKNSPERPSLQTELVTQSGKGIIAAHYCCDCCENAIVAKDEKAGPHGSAPDRRVASPAFPGFTFQSGLSRNNCRGGRLRPAIGSACSKQPDIGKHRGCRGLTRGTETFKMATWLHLASGIISIKKLRPGSAFEPIPSVRYLPISIHLAELSG